MCVFIFSQLFLSDTFLLRYDQKRMLVLIQSFEKHSDIKFHENPSSVSRGVPRRQTDRHIYAIAYKNNRMLKLALFSPFHSIAILRLV